MAILWHTEKVIQDTVSTQQKTVSTAVHTQKATPEYGVHWKYKMSVVLYKNNYATNMNFCGSTQCELHLLWSHNV